MKPLVVRVDNRIRLPLDGLDGDVASLLKKSCEHDNPDYSKRLAMGYSTYNVPAKIRTWRVEDGALTFPRGAMKRVRRRLREGNVAFRIVDARVEGGFFAKPIAYVGDRAGHSPRPYQLAAVDAALDREQGVVRAATGCLSGDTEVELNRAGKSFRCTLAHLVAMHNGGRAAGKAWDPEIETRIRMRDSEGFVRLGRVVDAYASGMKTTYLVETRGGRSVRATLDHRFLTESGWKRLGEIVVGERVYVDAGRVRGPRARKARYEVVHGMLHHPYSGRAAVRKTRSAKHRTCWKHRLVAEAGLNGVSYDEFVALVRAGRIDGLVFLDPKTHHVHHLDEDPRNNWPENLSILTMEDHLAEHGCEGWRHVTARTRLDEIVGVSNPRVEPTFDVEVAEDEHNFLANGIVVHNSGKTTTALYLASRIGLNTLVMLPNTKLLQQTIEVAEKLLGLKGDRVGILQAGKRRLRPFTVATQQTLWSRKVDDEVRDFFGAVMIDEAHHAAARTFAEVIDQFPARYRIAFSADERRKDRKEFLVYDAFGDVLHETSREQCEESGAVVDVEIRVVPTGFDAAWYRDEPDFDKLLVQMTGDAERNKIAIGHALEELRAGEQVIVLTHRREHARALDRMLVEHGIKSGLMLGGAGADANEFVATRDGLRAGEVDAGVGTYEALGEGIDLPAVAVGIAMTPLATNKQRMNQVRGRLCRPSKGKTHGRLYVMFDERVFDDRAYQNILAWNRTVKLWHRGEWVDARAHRRAIMRA